MEQKRQGIIVLLALLHLRTMTVIRLNTMVMAFIWEQVTLKSPLSYNQLPSTWNSIFYQIPDNNRISSINLPASSPKTIDSHSWHLLPHHHCHHSPWLCHWITCLLPACQSWSFLLIGHRRGNCQWSHHGDSCCGWWWGGRLMCDTVLVVKAVLPNFSSSPSIWKVNMDERIPLMRQLVILGLWGSIES
jgi:hypothetical protein